MDRESTICVAGDHAGFELKEKIKSYLEQKGLAVVDCGAKEYDGEDDYPIFASALASSISKGECRRGVLFCGTGVGASIAANRYKGVRAALCFTPEMAQMSRAHNDSNVLVLGARTTPENTAKQILDEWLDGEFSAGRHSRRVKQLDNLPEK
ncbi:Ribose 5-phosphate isomerase [Chitinispirillum alkaliphilum]|nr:Ribose 5-phosphate isomerase [Chitinispirillum alkaliphilum]